ncbi:hypothetical protein [Bartonella quintana]|uniref:Uncharacterized protein n=3 Tax=Bartonella quintana TaxID=803 RepID=A0A0H3LW49_BARQU|nr:hypothetical protein [Bartonella quintana]ETS13296.1 hypothetical protein Q651_00249 [Bartonella quintana BQ2-D70]ETS14047.1 hypothetical protein Q650_00667 [Bartonella quintana JK 73rel]ETS15734.1 hypothetical protein Q649_00676 [Bartonella quintana JK 73]ETS17737.1 hypothetical protein Q647_00665 [Bartonella quintana JK 7]ETS18566.1 hypothetical protein Q648_00254 [Bartonella quintana JK 12]
MVFCGRRIVLCVFVFLVFAASLFASRNVAIYQFLFGRFFSSHQVDVTEAMLLERLAISFPDIIMELSKLNPQQQKQVIEQIRQYTIATAFASGQSDEDAQKLGRAVVVAILKAISHPSIGDAYF